MRCPGRHSPFRLQLARRLLKAHHGSQPPSAPLSRKSRAVQKSSGPQIPSLSHNDFAAMPKTVWVQCKACWYSSRVPNVPGQQSKCQHCNKLLPTIKIEQPQSQLARHPLPSKRSQGQGDRRRHPISVAQKVLAPAIAGQGATTDRLLPQKKHHRRQTIHLFTQVLRVSTKIWTMQPLWTSLQRSHVSKNC